jgi:hypothetical protein
VTDEERHGLQKALPPLVLQVVGLICLLTAVRALYDGWYVLGALGVALVFGRPNDLHLVLGVLDRFRRRG